MSVKWSWLTVCALVIACGSSSSSGSSATQVSCDTGNDNGNPDCACRLASQGNTTTCDGTLGGSATCCADPHWPSSGNCVCNHVSCTTRSDHTQCSCGFDTSGGTATSCSLGTGVCCTDGQNCTCYANQTSCGGQISVGSTCSAAVIGCTDYTPPLKQVPSCSATSR